MPTRCASSPVCFGLRATHHFVEMILTTVAPPRFPDAFPTLPLGSPGFHPGQLVPPGDVRTPRHGRPLQHQVRLPLPSRAREGNPNRESRVSSGTNGTVPFGALFRAIRSPSSPRSPKRSGITSTVFGATGFLGRYVVNHIAKSGSRMILPSRCNENARQHLKVMGDLGQIVSLDGFSVRDDDAIKYAVARSNVVVNMVGREWETRNFSFEAVHVDFPSRLAEICKEVGVERLVHVSALGATETHPSKYYRTKAIGDAAVKAAFPNATIVKPAKLIGTEDRLLNVFAEHACKFPATPLIDDGGSKHQPVFVDDVGLAIQAIVEVRISHPTHSASAIAHTLTDTFFFIGPGRDHRREDVRARGKQSVHDGGPRETDEHRDSRAEPEDCVHPRVHYEVFRRAARVLVKQGAFPVTHPDGADALVRRRAIDGLPEKPQNPGIQGAGHRARETGRRGD
jgi:uncharacterized protein YbjT (DUF2867 family)